MSIQRTQPAADAADAFFPVEIRPLQAPDRLGRWQPLPRFRAVVDAERDSVLAVVAPGYRLLSNQAAFGLAQEVLAKAFRHHRPADLQCFAVRLPASRSYCEIDLIHPEAMFKLGATEQWTMFVRLVNSYNRSRRLRLSFGFCRWICQNGMVMGAQSIEMSAAHNADLRQIRAELARRIPDIQALEAQFVERMGELQACPFPPDRILDLACHAFELRVPTGPGRQRLTQQRLCALRDQVRKVADAYFEELGATAYAALNVLTDCASHPQGEARSRLQIDALQRKAGAWAQALADALHIQGPAALQADMDRGAEAAKQLKALVMPAPKTMACELAPSLNLALADA